MKLLQHTRRHDITFSRTGRISITARVVRILSIRPGDSINIDVRDGEYYLFSSRNTVGRHIAQCYPTKKGSHNYCANSVALAKLMLDKCKVQGVRASFMVGREMMINGEVYLPIIYKKPL